MFESYYNTQEESARPIAELIAHFEKCGTQNCHAATNGKNEFTAEQWKAMSKVEKENVLMDYRIAYRGNTMVNWCPKLGTVLANDEVSEGVSVRGGYPVVQKMMSQWCLRVSAYAGRLLRDLENLDWTDSIKETQRNWIGYSEGAEMLFPIVGSNEKMLIFTTRADTIFGVTFMVLAPESEYVAKVTTAEQQAAVEAYLEEVKHKTERERMIEKKVSGVWSGSWAVNPVTGDEIPIYISDYVLAGYGTGAIMAVPNTFATNAVADNRDYADLIRDMMCACSAPAMKTCRRLASLACLMSPHESRYPSTPHSSTTTGKSGAQRLSQFMPDRLHISNTKPSHRPPTPSSVL